MVDMNFVVELTQQMRVNNTEAGQSLRYTQLLQNEKFQLNSWRD